MPTTTAGNRGTSRKLYFKYKEMLKKKDNKDTYRASTSEKSE